MQVENLITKSYHCVCEDKEIIDDDIYPSVKSSIAKIIRKEEYISYNVQTKQRQTDGSNYLSKTCEVDVKGRTPGGNKETNIFIKQSLLGEGLTGIVDMKEIFSKEIFYYMDLMVIFEKLQREAGIPSDQMLKHVKCYSESNSEAIIMENLRRKGFKVLHRMATLPLSFAQLSVKEMAKFHALSFIVEQRMPDYFERKIKSLKYSLTFSDVYKKMATNIMLSATEKMDESIKNKIRKYSDLHIERYTQYYTAEAASANCLCHGDFRINNILAKEIDGEITEVIPIDYQTIFYGCPLIDLAYLIYMNSDRTFRQNHENDLKELYFETLKEFLHKFDIDIEAVFPKKLYDEEFKKIREYGFYVCLFILPFMYANENDLPDFEKSDATDMTFEVDDKYCELMTELCEDFSHLINI